jgi:hypothetical protein
MTRTSLRYLTGIAHAIDHAIGLAGGLRDVLVDARKPVYLSVLGPVANRLADRRNVRVWFTSEYPERIRPLVPPQTFLTREQAEWRRFSLYLNADPWAAVRLRRCQYRVNFFHGVAGKYDLDRPSHLPMGFETYDRVAFVNRDRMQRYLEAGIVSLSQAALVGYPKLDRLASGGYDSAGCRAALGLDSARPTAVYAPTYSEGSSLHLAGEDIVRALAAEGFNVVVKLHDRSLDSDPRYNAGVDWRRRFEQLEVPGRILYLETSDASPALAAADLMVTDHSSIGFEYLVLDRPLVIFDAPQLIEAARINPDKVALLRGAAVVGRTASQVAALARQELAAPRRLSRQRRRVVGEMFHDLGNATARSIAVIDDLLSGRGQHITHERAVDSCPVEGLS